MSTQMTVRLNAGQPEKLEEIARINHNTPSGLVRWAVDQLISAAEQQGGSLMAPLRTLSSKEKREQAAA